MRKSYLKHFVLKKKNTKKLGLILAGCLLGALFISGSVWMNYSRAQSNAPTWIFGGTTPSSFAELAKQVQGAVVNISTTKNFKVRRGPFYQFHEDYYRRYFRDQPEEELKRPNSLGSGFILNKDGYILTNNHVVEGADEIEVKLSDGRSFQAKVVGTDPQSDIAVIKINARDDLPTVRLGDSDAIQVGDWVVAIGNPFGLTQTVTSGILSARGRAIGAGPYDNFLQTDASINPGNSGGPLFNLQGEVVGVNTAIIAGGQGIGFAIPINQAKVIIPQLIQKGTVERGYLGIGLQPMTDAIAKQLGLDKVKGVLVAQVYQDSPAHHAGLQAGDVILKFKGKEIKRVQDLPILVSQSEVGSTAEVEFLRDGKSQGATVTLASLNYGGNQRVVSSVGQGWSFAGKMGLAVRDLSAAEQQRYKLGSKSGVVITQVNPGSPASDVGLQAGDVILEFNKKPVTGQQQFFEDAQHLKSGEVVRLFVKRGALTSYFAFSI